ncbi:MAG: hypothetical protein JNL98_36250 [Bryobacterales bacterium]|nr:hypothetical protein [Bryobacterales bacterium]
MKSWLIIAVALLGACVASGQMDLTLLTSQKTYKAGEPVLLTWKLQNSSRQPWIVFSHTATPGGDHYDTLTLEIEGPGGKRRMVLMDQRTASKQVACQLESGSSLENTLDLVRWTGSYSYPLTPGAYSISARYEMTKDHGASIRMAEVQSCAGGQPVRGAKASAWTGSAAAPKISFSITP